MIAPGVADWLLVAVCGGLVGMDGISGPQSMISRPIVAALLGGTLFGDPWGGFLLGALLELLFLRRPPLGAAPHPDAGPAALVAGAGLALADAPGAAVLAALLLCAWLLGWAGARTVRLQRLINARLIRDREGLARRPSRLERRQRLGAAVDFLRGAVLAALFLVPVAAIARLVPPGEGAGEVFATGGLVLAVAAAAGAGGRTITADRRRDGLLAAGAIAGMVAWVSLA